MKEVVVKSSVKEVSLTVKTLLKAVLWQSDEIREILDSAFCSQDYFFHFIQ